MSTDNDYEKMLKASEAKRERNLEKARASAERRIAEFTKTLQTKKVRLDYEKVGENDFNSYRQSQHGLLEKQLKLAEAQRILGGDTDNHEEQD